MRPHEVRVNHKPNDWCPYKKRDIVTHREKDHVMMETGIRVILHQGKLSMLVTTKTWRRQGRVPEPSEGARP
jgi:hypothetical protein